MKAESDTSESNLIVSKELAVFSQKVECKLIFGKSDIKCTNRIYLLKGPPNSMMAFLCILVSSEWGIPELILAEANEN